MAKKYKKLYFGLLIATLLLTAMTQNTTDLSLVENKIDELEEELDQLKAYVETVKPTEHCDHLKEQGAKEDGTYHLSINGTFIQMYCQFEHNDTEYNWLIFQRRGSGDVDFYRNWKNYTDGFGNLTGNFWLGLEKLHRITKTNSYILRIDMVDADGKHTYAEYTDFSIGDANDKYRLNVGTHSGTAVDSLVYHNGLPFSTMDNDNDNWSSNCAVENLGAWWYNSCYRANLNGMFYGGGLRSFQGIVWFSVGGLPYTKESVEMKIRPS